MADLIVKQQEGMEVTAEVLATAITKISEGLEGWKRAGMKRHALITLLVQSTKVCRRDVERVLEGIDSLQTTYCFLKPVKAVKK